MSETCRLEESYPPVTVVAARRLPILHDMTPPLRLRVLPGSLAVARLDPGDDVPEWAWTGPVTSVTRTETELSILCAEEAVPEDVTAARRWRALQVTGPLDFGLVGVLARITETLATVEVSIFAVSTYDTDLVLVPEGELSRAVEALARAGYRVVRD